MNHESHYAWLNEELPAVGEGGKIRLMVVTWNKHGLSLGT